ncbi:MAG: ABC transporter ATP-binding protein [Planctomycetes bacterium]|nr:ABC transporter ATP-binding protein [Planctomycetota bacterium]
MSEGPNILSAKRLHKSFGRGDAAVHVLRGLDIDVRRGEFLAVMGPSGCGKSTLLHILGMMTQPDAGSIELDGKAVEFSPAGQTAIRKTRVGFVFQRFNLLGVLSARDNVNISLQIRGLRPDGRADELFGTLGIAHVVGKKPGQMSIGEQQRVAVARALAHNPDILLADEPTGNLDSQNAARLLELLREINRSRGQTILMITHSSEASAAADRILRMKDGRIVG